MNPFEIAMWVLAIGLSLVIVVLALVAVTMLVAATVRAIKEPRRTRVMGEGRDRR